MKNAQEWKPACSKVVIGRAIKIICTTAEATIVLRYNQGDETQNCATTPFKH